jgi:hypothetical protein
MFQIDPWEKAADCDRTLRLTIDPVRREILTNIREFWVSLARSRQLLSNEELGRQAEAIGRLHTKLMDPTSVH